jgi:hypothetical protein
MSSETEQPKTLKTQYPKDGTLLGAPNKSPSKQTFSTIKNFLRNKSSLTDLRVWHDSKKDDNKFSTSNKNDQDMININKITVDGGNNKDVKILHESKSATKLSEFKLKIPKKKRSLGSLLPQLQQDPKNLQHDYTYLNNSIERINTINDIKQLPTPGPTSTQKFLSAASSPQLNLFRHSSSSTKASSSKNTSPTKAFFSLDIIEPHNPSTPPLSMTATLESGPKDWCPPTTIRGTYLHDWSNNSSPRSLSESLKVGRVEKHLVSFESPTKADTAKPSNYNAGHLSRLNPDTMNEEVLDSQNKGSQKLFKLDIHNLIEPSNPLPSPCTINTKNEIDYITSHDNENTSSSKTTTNSNYASKSSLCLNSNSNLNSISISISNSNSNSNSNCGSDFEDDSNNSTHSIDSQFSYLRNRTSSIRFYKSNEQVQRENAIQDDRRERQKMREFLGTSEDTENELLEGLSSNSRKIVNCLDEEMNYIDYNAEDDTDALFNRDLFGLSSKKHKPELKIDSSKNFSNNYVDDEYEYKTPTGLEITDEACEFNQFKTLRLTENEYVFKQATNLELGDNENGSKPSLYSRKSDIDDVFRPSSNLEPNNDEYEFKLPSSLEINDDEHNYQAPAISKANDEGKEKLKHEIKANVNQSTINQIKGQSTLVIGNKKKEIEKKAEASSKAILEMLNHPGLLFKPNVAEINIKHTPSAKCKHHRAIKFHQLSGAIEDKESSHVGLNDQHSNHDEIWENPSALDEVNSLPDDYEFGLYEEVEPELINAGKNSKLSATLLSSSVQDNEFEYFENTGAAVNKQHLWKNLVTKNNDETTMRLRVERIQLSNRTITIFKHSVDDINEEDAMSILSQKSNKQGDLSTIME